MYKPIIEDAIIKVNTILANNKDNDSLVRAGCLKLKISLLGIEHILRFYGDDNKLSENALMRLFNILIAVSMQIKKLNLPGYVY